MRGPLVLRSALAHFDGGVEGITGCASPVVFHIPATMGDRMILRLEARVGRSYLFRFDLTANLNEFLVARRTLQGPRDSFSLSLRRARNRRSRTVREDTPKRSATSCVEYSKTSRSRHTYRSSGASCRMESAMRLRISRL